MRALLGIAIVIGLARSAAAQSATDFMIGKGSVRVQITDGGMHVTLCSGERYTLDTDALVHGSPLSPHINTNVPTPGGAIVWTEGAREELHSWCTPERLRKVGAKQMRRPARERGR